MENDKTIADEFLGDLTNKGQEDPFDNKAPDILPTEEKKEEIQEDNNEEVEVKPLPFHKDPKVQRYVEKEISKALAGIQKETKEEPTTDDIDEVLTRIIGNDTDEKKRAIIDFKKILLEREDRGAEKAYQRLTQEREAEAQEEAEAENTLLSGFESIEEETGIDLFAPENKKLKGQFIDYIRKVAPKNEDGEVIEFPDFIGTFEAFQSTRQSSNTVSQAKKFASKGTERGSNNPASVQNEDKSWNAVDRIFDGLSG